MPEDQDRHIAAIARVKQQLPTAQQLFAGWPTAKPALPATAYTDADLYAVHGFDDPRLMLYCGISRAPSASATTMGWCLFGAASNVRTDRPALPPAVREALADPDAVRALQLMAVDHKETDEAAAEALTSPGAVRAMAAVAVAAYQAHEGRTDPVLSDVGTEIYAVLPGPVQMGTTTADVVCIGSPIWIGTKD
ncbi:hypothetical protein [Streptomyces sp. NPDC059063]|uniref:hypothetical protein n=1 Tax=unclassified Streptomyces TaxID=2593676 RepID=UPI00369B3826